MIIYFVGTESEEETFFAETLAGHDLRFVKKLAWVGEDAEIVSIFIDVKIEENFLERHPQVRCVATRSHSTDHIDVGACLQRGVEVCSVPAYGEETVAEHTFGLILALSRRLREVMSLPKNGKFSYEAARGFELKGKTLGIVGMGRMGQSVAKLARGFSMEVLANDPEENAPLAEELGFRYVSLPELLSRSRVISLHARLSAESYHLINAQTVAQCQRGVLIINTARGALIDIRALREGLESGQIGGAGLDVLEDERIMRDSPSHIISEEIVAHLLSSDCTKEWRDPERLRAMQDLMLGDQVLSRPNVVFTPHVAFNSQEAVAFLRQATLENITRFLRALQNPSSPV